MHEYSGLNGGPQKDVHLKPVNVTVFGKRIFDEVLRLRLLRCDHPDLE